MKCSDVCMSMKVIWLFSFFVLCCIRYPEMKISLTRKSSGISRGIRAFNRRGAPLGNIDSALPIKSFICLAILNHSKRSSFMPCFAARLGVSLPYA